MPASSTKPLPLTFCFPPGGRGTSWPWACCAGCLPAWPGSGWAHHSAPQTCPGAVPAHGVTIINQQCCQCRWTPGQKTSLPTTGTSHPSCNITWSESANKSRKTSPQTININIPGIKTKAQDCALWIDFAYFTVPSGKFLHVKTIKVLSPCWMISIFS